MKKLTSILSAILFVALFWTYASGFSGMGPTGPSLATVAATTLTATSATITTGTVTTLTSTTATITNETVSALTVSQPLGAELAPALTEANWTHGAGWQNPVAGAVLVKESDGTGTQTTTAATTIVAGTTYKIVITLSAASVGSASYTLGGVTGASSLAAATTYTDYLTATSTGKIIITPTNTSRLTISAISYKAVSGGIIGTTTNDLAPAGTVGEFKTSLVPVGSPVTLTTTNTTYDITSIQLTAGAWIVSGNVNIASSSGTITAEFAGFNTTSATLPTDGSEVASGILTVTASDTDSITLPPKIFLLSTTSTVYMSVKCTKAAGTLTGYGAMTCVRLR